MLMTKVGILSGGGKLPLLIGKKLIQSKYDVMFFCIEKFSDLKLYKDYNFKIISINSLTRILNNLKKNKIEKIIMAGKVKRPSIKDINFDLNALKLNRLTNLMTKAAKRNEVFHLWWHPHNFGVSQSHNIDFLTLILKHYKKLKEEYGMESHSMSSL